LNVLATICSNLTGQSTTVVTALKLQIRREIELIDGLKSCFDLSSNNSPVFITLKANVLNK
jgi:hypothetical protein